MVRPVVRLLLSISLCVILACGSGQEPSTKQTLPLLPKDEVLLAADSSKRAMIVEQTLGFELAPVMGFVAGKIAYDETVMARISTPVTGRTVGFVDEAMPKLVAKGSLPPGYHIVCSGQFEDQQRSMKRLSIIVPISLT